MVGALGKTIREMAPAMDESWFEIYGAVADTGTPARLVNHAPALGRWYDVFAARVGDPGLKQVAVLFRDITGRKLAEEERENLLLRESAARQEAEEASRLRDDFLATVSHELRTPLNAMLGWVQMMRSGALSPEKNKHALETIERNARVQSQLIDDLLDLGRILAGKLRLELEVVDLRAIVQAARDTIQPAALAKDVTVDLSADESVAVEGDPARLQQIVWNLLSNAVKFTPKGGLVRISVSKTAECLVRVVVSDTGVGIDSKFLPHVFERFRQANGSTTRSHGGLGLGLAIVKQLVELHGGTVVVESEGLGKGATFSVELPIVLPIRAPEANRAVGAPPSAMAQHRLLQDLDVVVVEDEADTRDMLRTLVELLGGTVRTATNASEGYSLVEQQPPDLLLSDIGMPGEDGYSLIARIRQLPSAKGGDVIAVALTAYSRLEERTRALRAGFDNHIAKPIETTELIAVLGALTHRMRRAQRSR